MKWANRIVALLLVLVWMAVIFHYSNQPAIISSDLSGSLSYSIVETYGTITNQDWQVQEINENASRLEFPVRKAAHMTEYGILAILGFFLMKAFGRKRVYILAVMLAFFYACTDEFHQLFVEGRDGSFRDVCIDTIGALLFLFAFSRLWKKLSVFREGEKNQKEAKN